MPKKNEVPHGGMVRRLRLSNLSAASYNPRVIADDAFRGLRESLTRFGMLEMPVVNVIEGEFRLVSGHQRVSALLAEGVEFADCLLVKLTAEQEKIANLTMNNPAIRGRFDPLKAIDQLPALADSLPTPDFAKFDSLIADLRAKADQMTATTGAEAAEQTDKPKGKPKSKAGNLYRLGKHLLYCGDFQDGVKLLLGKKKAKACITDPPYNVDYESAAGVSIANDAMSPDEWATFVSKISTTILATITGPAFVFMSSKEVPSLARAWQGANGAVVRWLWWVKDRFTLGRGDYHHQHEPCLLGHRQGASPELFPGLTSVLEFPKPASNTLHPTQKPIALIRALMESCTNGNDVVFDPFLGSGTTLVVAEEIGRVCVGSELSPEFCDAIRKRWAEQAHGNDADWVKLTPLA